MAKKTILVVGGAGYIGSHVNAMLNETGFQTIVLDNLSRGHAESIIKGTFVKGDLADLNLLDDLFQKYSISAVMHFAALTDVGESVQQPLKYFNNNVSKTLNLLMAMQKHHVDALVFSSSAAVYGLPQQKRIAENHPCQPINPYGHSKLMVETVLQQIEKAHQIRSCSLRYFNAAGGDPRAKIKYFLRPETNIIPKILNALKSSQGSITINGTDYPTPDGTCVRDYIHIEDLGNAHIIVLKQLLDGAKTSFYNLGNGNGFSVKEVIAAAEKVTQKKLQVTIGPRREGDPPILVADASKAQKELKWYPQFPRLEDMITHAWKARET